MKLQLYYWDKKVEKPAQSFTVKCAIRTFELEFFEILLSFTNFRNITNKFLET